MPCRIVCLGMLVPSCLGMWDLVSKVVTTTLGGGCLFPGESIGSFRSCARRDFVSERYVY